MISKQIHFKIFSEGIDSSFIDLSINQINFDDVSIKATKPKTFDLKPQDVVILGLHSLEDKILDNAIQLFNVYDNTFIIVTDSDDVIFTSTLARLGFNNIYIIPYELQKFKSFLNEVVENFTIKYRSDLDESEKFIYKFDNIIGRSPELIKTVELAKKISENHEVSVLILGETGTGKGLLAQTIHKNSPNSTSPFVDIVCTAIPVTLLESELFGYERGAFTDAKNRKLGLFELAEDGTVFLDEIGDLSLEIQVKLLKALDKKIVRRLGGIKDIGFNARIISATNRDLKKMVDTELFRIDLFHRLNVVSIEIPPLRSRGNDIIILAEHFIAEMAEKFGKEIPSMGAELKSFMLGYDWPGNVRELRNAIERAVLLSDSNEIIPEDLFQSIEGKFLKTSKIAPGHVELEIDYKKIPLESLTQIYAKEVLRKLNGNKSKTAKVLGISRPKLDKLLNS